MAKPKEFSIDGVVLDESTGKRAAGLQVEAWDKDKKIDDCLGKAFTDDSGAFSIVFDRSRFRTASGTSTRTYISSSG